jgi:RNA polymerase sigma factor (sigma-70 family)
MGPGEVSQSITQLIRDMQEGRASAVGPLLAHYFERLVQLAHKRLRSLPEIACYDEDIALRSFESLCRRMRDPARPLSVAGRDDLWRLLATRTVSRTIDLIRRHRAGDGQGHEALESILSREPTPEDAAEVADECRRLLDLLDEPELRQIALWKVDGYTNEEIAARLDCVPRTIERKVSRIRLLWRHELEALDA